MADHTPREPEFDRNAPGLCLERITWLSEHDDSPEMTATQAEQLVRVMTPQAGRGRA